MAWGVKVEFRVRETQVQIASRSLTTEVTWHKFLKLFEPEFPPTFKMKIMVLSHRVIVKMAGDNRINVKLLACVAQSVVLIHNMVPSCLSPLFLPMAMQQARKEIRVSACVS